MYFEINSEDFEDGDVDIEGQSIKMKVLGRPATLKEVEQHMINHIPYRSWCRHCISGHGQSDHHRQQLGGAEQEIPTISIDYAFLGESDKQTDKLQPMLVLKDRKSGTIRAHLVEEKGVNEYAIKRLGQDIALLGHKKIILKSISVLLHYSLNLSLLNMEYNSKSVLHYCQTLTKYETASGGAGY